jgi:hypothetical protein
MAYTIFGGSLPFASDKELKDGDLLRQDMREGVYIPLRLISPGLDNGLAQAISSAIGSKEEIKTRPAPDILGSILGDPGSRNVASWYTPVKEEERLKINAELEKYRKKRNITVKTRRFVIRNTTIIVICVAAVIGTALAVRGYFQRLADMPNTIGMTPVEVAETYYGSFETLNHEMMEACIYGKNAKLDIDMILNLYVLNRTRMAYEGSQTQVSAREWLEHGSPQTDLTVFGVTDLTLTPMGGSESQGEIILEARYKLWMPASYSGDSDDIPSEEELRTGNYTTPPPQSRNYLDRLELLLVKNAWRITTIDRTLLR